MTALVGVQLGSRPRLRALDGMRGIAMLLMVLDHALLVADVGGAVRLTVTRASLPLFLITAGLLWRGHIGSRWVQLVVAGLIATVIGAPLGIGQPDVLLVIAAGLAVLWATDRAGIDPRVVLVVALLQPVTWPAGLGGYEIGTVVGLLIAGRLATKGWTAQVFGWSPRWLCAVGRFPLTVYLGHLFVLKMAVDAL